MKNVLFAFSFLLLGSNALAAKYAVSCFDGNGSASTKFKTADIKDVDHVGSNTPSYKVEYYDGRIFYVPQAKCIVEVMKDSQSPSL